MIRIKASSQISFEDADRIKKAMRKLVGLEIVDEDGFHISAQFLLDANTLDAEKILRRMSAIVAGMYRDLLEAIRSKENSIRRVISGRDDEVDRQYFLLVRLIRSAMMDQKLAGKLNLSNIDILDYRIAANLLESAGDYIVDLAAAIQDFSRIRIVDEIAEAGALVEKMQEKSVAAFERGCQNVQQVQRDHNLDQEQRRFEEPRIGYCCAQLYLLYGQNSEMLDRRCRSGQACAPHSATQKRIITKGG